MSNKRVKLSNKPLVEAIFEIRWQLTKTDFGFVDPHYKVLVGRMYDKLVKDYPFHEALPSSNFPDGMLDYVVQHRFRKGNGEWPLIQIGPGILTVNDTENYVWEDFEKKVLEAIDILIELYPDAKKNININKILLQYIDAIEFDFEKTDILKFLKEKLKININLYDDLFLSNDINNFPSDLDLRFSYNTNKPKGVINIRFRRGKKLDIKALIWETVMSSNLLDSKNIRKSIGVWIQDSHRLIDDWFFKLIDGELLERFK